MNCPEHSINTFIKDNNKIWFMLRPIFSNLQVNRVNFNVPMIRLKNLMKNDLCVGYLIHLPKDIIVNKNYILVGKKGKYWNPSIGIPGLQVYTSEGGVLMISTEITHLYRNLS